MKAVLERPQTTTNGMKEDAFAPEPSIRERTIEAAKRFLEKRGYEVIQRWGSKTQLGFVVKDDETLAFVHVVSNGLDEKGFPPEPTMSQEDFEQTAISWLADREHDYTDMSVRFDELTLKVLREGRAFIRHHINAWGAC